MLSTSLQNIVAGDSCAKERGDITCLFLNKQYPTFQLAELQDSPLLTLPIFSTLLGVLLQWNQMAHSLPVHSDALYSRNRFIFFMLKSIAKGSERTSRVHLEKLFNWYNSNRQEQVQFLRRKSGFRAMVDEEWEIRKTYKSNLPLEYKTFDVDLARTSEDALNSKTKWTALRGGR